MRGSVIAGCVLARYVGFALIEAATYAIDAGHFMLVRVKTNATPTSWRVSFRY